MSVVLNRDDEYRSRRERMNRALAQEIHRMTGLGATAQPVTLYPAITPLLANHGYTKDQIGNVQHNASRVKGLLAGGKEHHVEEVIYFILMKREPRRLAKSGHEAKRAA